MDVDARDATSVPQLIKAIQEKTCFKKECYRWSHENSANGIIQEYSVGITLEGIVNFFGQDPFLSDKTHVPCIVSILHSAYQHFTTQSMSEKCSVVVQHLTAQSMSEKSSLIVQRLVLLGKICLDLPSKLAPCPAQTECESNSRYTESKSLNITLTNACFRFYLDILFTYVEISGSSMDINMDEDRIRSLADPTNAQKLILKATAAKAFSLACCRLGKQPWTNPELNDLSSSVCQCIKVGAKYSSYSVLLSGTDTEERSGNIFQNGLLGCVIDELAPSFHAKFWKKNLPNVHSLIWCVKNVKYPYLDKHISKIVPPLLLLMDDYVAEHKVLGILTLTHFIENVNPSQLRLYNHDAVIYDALRQQLFSSESAVHEAALSSLLKLLGVLHPKPDIMDGITFSTWDRTLEKIFENIEMSSKMENELVLLKFIPLFIDKMGGNVIKHLDRLIKLLSWPIRGYGTLVSKKRTIVFKILTAAMKSCWPVMSSYKNIILKLIFRILIDESACTALKDGQVEIGEIEDEAYQALCLLLQCCDQDVHGELTKVVSVEIDQQFLSIKRVVTRVLELKNHYDSS